MCYSASSYERIYELDKTFVKVLCNKATESMADLVSQLTPTLSRCSSVGNLIKYANFLATIKEKLVAKNIMPKKRKRIKCMRTRRTLPLWPIGPSNVTPSTKLGETAASFLPRVIISPKFWNLEIDGQGCKAMMTDVFRTDPVGVSYEQNVQPFKISTMKIFLTPC